MSGYFLQTRSIENDIAAVAVSYYVVFGRGITLAAGSYVVNELLRGFQAGLVAVATAPFKALDASFGISLLQRQD
jgi:hypothetical protein